MSDFWNALDFFKVSIIGGMGLALLSGPLGVLLLWQRLSYLSDALAHASLLGVALSVLFALPLLPTSLMFTGLLGVLLFLFLRTRGGQSSEGVLLLLTQGFMGIGLLVITSTRLVSVDVTSYLMGDFLTLSVQDAWIIWLMLGGAGCVLHYGWRPLLATIVHPELAAVAGVRVAKIQFFFLVLTSVLLVFLVRATGILLVTTLLIAPALCLRPWVTTPRGLCAASSALALGGVMIGFGGSLVWNAPPGPLIAGFLFLCFGVSQTARGLCERGFFGSSLTNRLKAG